MSVSTIRRRADGPGLTVSALEDLLGLWGLETARWDLVGDGVNKTLEIESPVPDSAGRRRFALRLYSGLHYDRDTIRSELRWLDALKEAGLRVPEGLPARGGESVVPARAVTGEDGSFAVLFRWLEGRAVPEPLSPATARRLGEFQARLHRRSEALGEMEGFQRPRYDLRRLLGPEGGLAEPSGGAPFSAADEALARRAREALWGRLRGFREEPGEVASGGWGLVHGDLQVTNFLFQDGEVGAIDFADFGWGFFLYDVAASLLPVRHSPDFRALREAFLRGYTQVRPLSPAAVGLLDTFLAARALFILRWTSEFWHLPSVRRTAETTLPFLKAQLRRFLGEDDPSGARGDGVLELLAQLRDAGITLWEEEGRLRFKAPEGAMSVQLRQELAQRKAELLVFLARHRQAGQVRNEPALRPLPRQEHMPLSFAQERLWILHRLEPDSPAYNISQAIRLDGRLSPAVLRRTLREIVRRHEILRTSFGLSEEDEPAQRIVPELALEIPRVDLRGLAGTMAERDREGLARGLADQLAAAPFDLGRLPLLRFVLLRTGDEGHLLLLSLHHIISDGWSSGILMREMATLYGDFLADGPPSLPELPLQYADFSGWQRRWLQGEVLERQLDYWRGQLEGAPGLLELPGDRPRPPVQSFRGGRREVVLERPLARRLEELGQQGGATLFMTLVAVYGALLFRYSGQRDLLLGYPIANRNRVEIEPLIGFFVNTLILRARFAPGQTFRALQGEMRRITLDAYSHQDLPFERLMEELHPDRDVSHTPLFQVMFTLQNAPLPKLAMPGLELDFVRPEKAAVQLDLDLTLRNGEDGLRGVLAYSLDLFDPTTAERLAGHFAALAAAAVEDPDLPLERLSLLRPGERKQLLEEWNDRRRDYPLDRTFPELLEEAFRRFPERPAVRCGDQAWTYRQLEERSTALARRLRREGLVAGGVAAVLARRGPDLLAVILAVLRCGGAYLPLDPHHPSRRLAKTLERGRPDLLVVEPGTETAWGPALEAFAAEDPPAVVELAGEEGAQGTPPAPTFPESLAYVIFTSGSTGTPKGAMVHQAGLVNHLLLMIDALELGPEDALAQTASQCFDISVWQFLTPLLVGGRVEILPDEVAHDPAALTRAVEERGITILQTVPSMLGQMLHLLADGTTRDGAFRDLRWMIPTGEALPLSLWRRWHERFGEIPLLNAYGPAECSDDVTLEHLRDPFASSSVPIGRPVANLRTYVVNGELSPAPVGVPGELAIGGVGVGWGYLGDPALTAAVFVPNPFAVTPGERLYLTRDLGRWSADGVLEFTGRLDHQVKIRGFRIELGEVEAALERHPLIEQAVAMAEASEEGAEQRLVAYLERARQGAPDVESLRAHVKACLPRYMVPSLFILLEDLPRNANGKVDRLALARAGGTTLELATAYAPPSTPSEIEMVEIWAELLDRQRIGIHDSFFDLGGNSLMATQLLARVRQRFAVELPLAVLFETPTAQALATAIDVVLTADAARRGGGREVDEEREEGEL